MLMQWHMFFGNINLIPQSRVRIKRCHPWQLPTPKGSFECRAAGNRFCCHLVRWIFFQFLTSASLSSSSPQKGNRTQDDSFFCYSKLVLYLETLVASPITNPFGIKVFFEGGILLWLMCQQKKHNSKTKIFDFVSKNHGKNYKELMMSHKHHKSKVIVSPSVIFLIYIQALSTKGSAWKFLPPSPKYPSPHMKKHTSHNVFKIWTRFHRCVKTHQSPVLSHLVVIFPKPNMAKTEQHNFA